MSTIADKSKSKSASKKPMSGTKAVAEKPKTTTTKSSSSKSPKTLAVVEAIASTTPVVELPKDNITISHWEGSLYLYKAELPRDQCPVFSFASTQFSKSIGQDIAVYEDFTDAIQDLLAYVMGGFYPTITSNCIQVINAQETPTGDLVNHFVAQEITEPQKLIDNINEEYTVDNTSPLATFKLPEPPIQLSEEAPYEEDEEVVMPEEIDSEEDETTSYVHSTSTSAPDEVEDEEQEQPTASVHQLRSVKAKDDSVPEVEDGEEEDESLFEPSMVWNFPLRRMSGQVHLDAHSIGLEATITFEKNGTALLVENDSEITVSTTNALSLLYDISQSEHDSTITFPKGKVSAKVGSTVINFAAPEDLLEYLDNSVTAVEAEDSLSPQIAINYLKSTLMQIVSEPAFSILKQPLQIDGIFTYKSYMFILRPAYYGNNVLCYKTDKETGEVSVRHDITNLQHVFDLVDNNWGKIKIKPSQTAINAGMPTPSVLSVMFEGNMSRITSGDELSELLADLEIKATQDRADLIDSICQGVQDITDKIEDYAVEDSE